MKRKHSTRSAKLSIEQLEATLRMAKPDQQRLFLMHLPQVLNLDAEDIAWLKLSEQSLEFWNNPDDAIYDTL